MFEVVQLMRSETATPATWDDQLQTFSKWSPQGGRQPGAEPTQVAGRHAGRGIWRLDVQAGEGESGRCTGTHHAK